MESRVKCLENKVAEADSHKKMLEEKNKNLMYSYQFLLQKFETHVSKDLNSKVNYDNQKRGS